MLGRRAGDRDTVWGRDHIVCAAIVFVATALPRLVLAVAGPRLSPDGTLYLNIARNILEHGCVSMSESATGLCVPHWGGNHLPGYPAFLALLGGDIAMARGVQILLLSVAVAWLSMQLGRLLQRPFLGGLAVLLLVVSPAHMAWGRFVLPDTLTVAVMVWIMAEIARALDTGRLPVLSLALALSAACWLRYDGVAACIPIAIAGFMIYPPWRAVRAGCVIALIVAVPLVAWSVRSAMQGLSWVPQPRFMLDGSFTPNGFLAWGNTWIVNLPQGAGFGYTLSNKAYDEIVIPQNIFTGADERRRVEALMADLARFNQQDFPPEIDARFAELAIERRHNYPVETLLIVPLRRILSFWLSPVASLGWPLEISSELTAEERQQWSSGGIPGKLAVAAAYPMQALGKLVMFGYRLGLVVGAIWLFVMLLRGPPGPWRVIAVSALAFALARSVALSFQLSIDPRYMITAQAALEIAIGVLITTLVIRQANARKHAGSRS